MNGKKLFEEKSERNLDLPSEHPPVRGDIALQSGQKATSLHYFC